tara:strand:+ start:156 stop:512 length:357 start_codon:yes stop_codon:yes gene_type:complete
MPAGPGTYGNKKGRPKKSSKWAGASLGQTPTGPATSSKWAGAKSPALSNTISNMTRSALTGMTPPMMEPLRELLDMTKRKGKYPPPKKKKVAGKKSPKVRAHTLHERAKAARRGSLSY